MVASNPWFLRFITGSNFYRIGLLDRKHFISVVESRGMPTEKKSFILAELQREKRRLKIVHIFLIIAKMTHAHHTSRGGVLHGLHAHYRSKPFASAHNGPSALQEDQP